MTKKIKTEVEEEVIAPSAVIEEEKAAPQEILQKVKTTVNLDSWNPKTSLGKKVKEGQIKDIDEILDNGLTILEAEIVDALVPNIEVDLLLIGQSKGKFGGGQRRVFKQTQKKTKEGNKPSFSTFAVVGNRNGYVGIGYGKSRDTVPAREKATRNAKLDLMKIKRGSGSWEGQSTKAHSIPFTITGKSGSVIVKLMPAPRGTGLVVPREVAKILALAGIQDVWSKTLGQTVSRNNLILATKKALQQLMELKVKHEYKESMTFIEGNE
jgi:small subunit ribosomal protein S5